MKALIVGLTMFSIFSSYAATEVSRIQMLSMGWHLPTLVEDASKENVSSLEWSEDSENQDELNVYFESAPSSCYIVKLKEVQINNSSKLIVANFLRAASCDK